MTHQTVKTRIVFVSVFAALAVGATVALTVPEQDVSPAGTPLSELAAPVDKFTLNRDSLQTSRSFEREALDSEETIENPEEYFAHEDDSTYIDLSLYSDEELEVMSHGGIGGGSTLFGGVATAAKVTPNVNSKKNLKAYALKKLKKNKKQFKCLEKLWQKESRWNYKAANNRSSARGIPQAMMSVHFGKNWKKSKSAKKYLKSGKKQIDWGLKYIDGRYKNACAAWSKSQSRGWY